MALKSEDKVDIETMNFWRNEALNNGRGWLHELGLTMKNIGLLEYDEFSNTMWKFLRWNCENASKVKCKFFYDEGSQIICMFEKLHDKLAYKN